MSTRKLIIFEHSSKMGNAPVQMLFDLIRVQLTKEPPRSFDDYKITIAEKNIPNNVRLIVK